ncbi:MAG: bifunctional alpha/beta hydrolase/OsmC family protein [Xanthomonadales bacterium]|nr:bifunctional alpha/beta hydrolase/OsmC family protein [Xanthomonadales bacterium]
MQQNVRFENSRGQKLTGTLHLPDQGAPRTFALFAHCFTCTRNVKAAVHISDALAGAGLGVLRFDFTGLGQSEGEFVDTHFSSNVEDLLAAAQWMADEHAAPRLLVGHSLGGTAVLAAAHRIENVVAVATIGSPADAEHVLHLVQDDIATIEREGEAEVKLAGRPFHIRREFLEDVRSQSVRDGIRSLRRALLILHSPVDELVSIDEASRIYSSALHPKSFVSLDDADHLLTRERDSRYAGRVLAAWASRYLGEEKASDTPRTTAVEGAVVAEARTADGFLTAMNADGHEFLADEPLSYGGTDLGPTPYDFLSAALGACTAMTLNVYARHKKLPLESVRVEVRHDRVHAEDCEDCETKEGKVDHFFRRIAVTGDLDAEARKRLLEIADRCPVHKTLEAEIKIRTEAAD